MARSLLARVRGGRLVLDEPADMADGTEIELIAAETPEPRSPADRQVLHAALQRADEQFRSGEGESAALVRVHAACM